MKISNLTVGHVVRHKNGEAYIVIREAGVDQPAIAVRQQSITNPTEWDVIVNLKYSTLEPLEA